MNTWVYSTAEVLAGETAKRLAEYVQANPGKLLCLAAGDTPLQAYGHLADFHRDGRIDLNAMWFVGLDEWVGIGYETPGSCRQVMFDGFYDRAGIDHSRILAFDGRNPDIDGQCMAVSRWIAEKGVIGLTVLGIGMNGHVGFNEPGSLADDTVRIVPLDATTTSVGQKYFPGGVVPTRGITVGMRELLAANQILMMASGNRKAPIVQRALSAEVTPEIPASLLRANGTLTVLLDEAAAGNTLF